MTLKAWPKPFKYFRDVKVFLVSLSLTVTLLLSAMFLLLHLSIRDLMLRSLQDEARSYAHQVILTRQWNAGHNGVFVEKRPGVDSNPFLKELGVDPDIRTADGRVLTLRNPAAMTREISELSRSGGGVSFRVVSLNHLNPDNRPDEFEREGLERFSQGAREPGQMLLAGDRPVFRYLVPLMTEESCLTCHRRQGYKKGDVRGGISITIPTESMAVRMRRAGLELMLAAATTIGLIVAIVYFMTWKLVIGLAETQKKLKHIAVTDELTGLRNRRYIMEQLVREYQRAVRSGSALSLILLDIDHFKRINDTYGHAFGDVVLKAVSAAMQSSLRSYDLLGRIGGEEFLIASPGSTIEDARGLAERILERVRQESIRVGDRTTSVTVSAGVTVLTPQDADAEALMSRADAGLYMAKQEGRDRVVAIL